MTSIYWKMQIMMSCTLHNLFYRHQLQRFEFDWCCRTIKLDPNSIKKICFVKYWCKYLSPATTYVLHDIHKLPILLIFVNHNYIDKKPFILYSLSIATLWTHSILIQQDSTHWASIHTIMHIEFFRCTVCTTWKSDLSNIKLIF